MKFFEFKEFMDSLDCPYAIVSPQNSDEEIVQLVLGKDSKEREILLKITPIQQRPSEEILTGNEDELPFRLQFSCQLPFKVDDMSLSQTASLLLFLNTWIDLPGFELHELKGEIYYRYVWLMQKSILNSYFFNTMVGAFILNLSLFQETIEKVASGKESFNDFLKSVVKLMKNK